MGLVYLAINSITNKSYIGKTTRSLSERINNHIYDANRGKGTYFSKALVKYGSGIFDWCVLEEVSNDGLNDAEIFWIAYFKYIGAALYNMTNGGDGHTTGYKQTDQHIRNKVNSQTGKKRSVETRRKISKANTGYKHTDEAKQKMLGNQNGRANKGKRRTEEQRKQMSIANSGRIPWNKGKRSAEEICQAARERMLGVKRGPYKPRKQH
jgi:group I intron endonuclease